MRNQANQNLAPVRRAFTLIEIMVVVIILGILASVVIPQFSNATTAAKESTLKEDLRNLRTQILIFKAQHRDVSPGYPNGDPNGTPDAVHFIDQLTMYSDQTCNTGATPSSSMPFGPYLAQMPPNPFSSQNGVLIFTGTLPAPDNTQAYGWMFNPATLQFVCNLEGSDPSGVPYISY